MSPPDVEIGLESIAVAGENANSQDHNARSVEPQPADTEVKAQDTWLQRNRVRIFTLASKIAAIISLVLTAVMAWPAISSAGDTRLATLLAEWTSQKEYLEFCEARSWEPKGCAAVKNVPLPPPPTKLTLLRRLFTSRPTITHYRDNEIDDPWFSGPGWERSLRNTPRWSQDLPSFRGLHLAIFCCVTFLYSLEALRRIAKSIRRRRAQVPNGTGGFRISLSASERPAPPSSIRWIVRILDAWTSPAAPELHLPPPPDERQSPGWPVPSQDSPRLRLRRPRARSDEFLAGISLRYYNTIDAEVDASQGGDDHNRAAADALFEHLLYPSNKWWEGRSKQWGKRGKQD